ncbi:hypothetical protein ABEB36_007634 [Hypothenemus hampei]|uniref:Scavenger receptor class B member 1 n=1 Tax=Hypothenemus hampei TaxID=57062 RepID=A0ABD1EUM5_HYPHA
MTQISDLWRLNLAILCIALGLSSLIYTPTKFFFDLRLRMIPGTPPYTLWANPPSNLLANVYVFNTTNSERFLNGSDDFLHLQEIGPIIYKEEYTHENIKFNENSTLTYTVTRTPVYLPEKNTINLNDTIIAPNLAMLVLVAYFSSKPFLLRTIISTFMNRFKNEPFTNMTLYNYLHNASSPMLEACRPFAPSLVPTSNAGVLHQVYLRNKFNITVKIGPKYGNENFFAIDNIDGSDWLPTYSDCKPKFNHTSEPTLFPQFLTKNQTLRVWKSILCQDVGLKFAKVVKEGIYSAYHYTVPLDTFNRTIPENKDCFKGDPILPNGLSDISTCYSNYPFAASFPHFMGADSIVSARIKGLKPDIKKHGSYLTAERLSGVPLKGRAVFQVNLVFNKIYGFGEKLRRFTDLYMPISYISYEIDDWPASVTVFLYVLSILIPNSQLIMSISFLIIGLWLLYYPTRNFFKSMMVNTKRVESNRKFYEQKYPLNIKNMSYIMYFNILPPLNSTLVASLIEDRLW